MAFKRFLHHITVFLNFVTDSVLKTLKSIFATVITLLWKILKTVFGAIGHWLVVHFKQPLYEVWCHVLTPIAHAWGHIDHSKIRIRSASKKSFKHALKELGRALWKALLGCFAFLKWAFNYVAPAVCIAFLIALIKYAGTMQYTVSVNYNGNELGTIQNEASYNEAQALVMDKLTYTANDESVITTPTFSVKLMSDTDNAVNVDDLSELIIESGDISVTDAYGFYINNELIGVYTEEEMLRLKTVLEQLLGAYYTSNTATVDFVDSVAITQGRFLETNLSTADDAIELVTSERTVEAYYVIQKNDSVSLIASKLAMSKDELLEYNPFLANGTHTGDLVTYYYTEPYLSVMTTRFENYDQTVEMQIVYQYSSKLERGCEYMKQRGSSGSENVTALITEINGVESERMVISNTVIEEMVPRVFVTGTKENTTIDDMSIIEQLGTFCWPVGGDNYVSSLYGYRSWDHSTHRGIDIAAKKGTPIYAAASGTVTMARTYSTYGKLVVIDHGNGIKTYYAHQSAILVSEGDYVEKGDLIGEVGMTGSASGNHLHFELRIGNDRVDPLLCLGGVGSHRVNE